MLHHSQLAFYEQATPACSTRKFICWATGGRRLLLTMVQELSSKVLRAHPTIIDC